jgi:DNA polymerase-3 subunit alpha
LEVSHPDVTAVDDHPMTISMPVIRCTQPVVERLREILAEHPGVTDVHLRLTQPGRSTVMRLDNGLRIEKSPALYGDLKALLGPGCLA